MPLIALANVLHDVLAIIQEYCPRETPCDNESFALLKQHILRWVIYIRSKFNVNNPHAKCESTLVVLFATGIKIKGYLWNTDMYVIDIFSDTITSLW